MRTSTDNSLKILNILMRTGRFLTAKEIMNYVGCNNVKTIYSGINKLECSGFPIEEEKGSGPTPNRYKWTGEVCGW